MLRGNRLPIDSEILLLFFPFFSFFSSPLLSPAASPYHADFISILWDVSRRVAMFHRLFYNAHASEGRNATKARFLHRNPRRFPSQCTLGKDTDATWEIRI